MPHTSTPPSLHILVLCTGNSARSIMAEALLSTLSQGRWRAYSAGSQPTGRVNPYAIEQVLATGYPVEHLRSKSWDEFARPDAPHMDCILTVCDNAAGEVCPMWPGHPITAHWGFADPAAVEGDEATRRRAFQHVFQQIERRVQAMARLPLQHMDRASIQQALRHIGQEPV